jgi:hypothetical protein
MEGIVLERKVANLYEDTRELLNQLKDKFDFKSDDQAVKFLCEMFMTDDRTKLLERYVNIKNEKKPS